MAFLWCPRSQQRLSPPHDRRRVGGMEMARQKGESGRVCLTRQVWHAWVDISEASQGDFVVIAAQCHTFWQCHPKVRHGVIWVQRLAGIAGKGEDHGAVESQCRTHHLETLWRRGTPAPPSGPGAALARDGTATDPDYVAFPGVETGRVTGPLNLVLYDVSPPAGVQDGFHVKVVWRHDLLGHRKSPWLVQSRHRPWCRCLAWLPRQRSYWSSDSWSPWRTGDGSCSS